MIRTLMRALVAFAFCFTGIVGFGGAAAASSVDLATSRVAAPEPVPETQSAGLLAEWYIYGHFVIHSECLAGGEFIELPVHLRLVLRVGARSASMRRSLALWALTSIPPAPSTVASSSQTIALC